MTITERQATRDKLRLYAYYILIGVISLVSIVFLPMLTSTVNGDFQWPTDTLGWIIWAATRIGIALVNVCFFALFKAQARINVKDNENYKKANEILNQYNRYKKIVPRGPVKYQASSWGFKGTILLLTSAVSTFVFTEAILRFDLVAFLSYVFTIVVGLVFSYFTMRKDEDYYIDEYYQYALIKKAEMDNEKQESEKPKENKECLNTEIVSSETSKSK